MQALTKTSSSRCRCNFYPGTKRNVLVHCQAPNTPGTNKEPNDFSSQEFPDRRRLHEVRKINQERLKNMSGVISTIKTYFDSEMELRKSLMQEILRIAKTDGGLSLGHRSGSSTSCNGKANDDAENKRDQEMKP